MWIIKGTEGGETKKVAAESVDNVEEKRMEYTLAAQVEN